MSLVLMGSTSGSVTLQEPAVAGSTVLSLPATTGTVGLTTSQIGMKNRIINGAMVISQRGTSFSVSTTGTYTTDRFAFAASGGGVITATQDSTAPAGFTNSLKATVATADSSIAAGDEYAIYQAIEGFNIADMGFGTASAQNITLSFWVRSSITGTYSGALYTSTRSYIFTYTISAANTFEYKTISLTADTSGTYNTTNGVGTIVGFDLGSGSNFNGTASTWQNGSFLHRVSGSVNWISTLGATFFITGVQLELGSAATTFDFRAYGTELALCQRYFQLNGVATLAAARTSTGLEFPVQYFVPMRANATASQQAQVLTVYDAFGTAFAQSAVSVTTAVTSSSTLTGQVISLNNFTGLTQGRTYWISNASFPTAALTFSAEL